MNEINLSYLNKVKRRFLPLPRNATEELEHEPNINDFTIIKELGNGSYGKVYYVSHKKTKAKFAIKAIDKLNIENKREKAYFNREVEIMYKIDHPNIGKLYGHFEDEKYCYLVMQYIPNGSAYNLLPKNGSKPNLSLIASIIRDVIRAVYYLHNMIPIVIHRDIKPENVLLDEENNAYLTDFGWSNYIINNRRRNTICGTPIYYSPEMVEDIPYDERVDIWSIGILLFELSTGKIPFGGNSVEMVKNNISKLNISWPYNIDNDVKDLCNQILKTSPNQRLTLENILNHKFFKKYLNDSDKKLIKPKKNYKNKIFIFSKDVPENSENKNNNEINNKKYFRSQRLSKEKNIICNFSNCKSNNKNNTDSKINLIKKIEKCNIYDKEKNDNNNNYKCNSNYINKMKVERKLMIDFANDYNTSHANNTKVSFISNNNDSYGNIQNYHNTFSSSTDLQYYNKKNPIIDINKKINTKIYSSSFLDNREKNKINSPRHFITHINCHSNANLAVNNKNLNIDQKKKYINKNMKKYNTVIINNDIKYNRRKNLENIQKVIKDKDIKIIQIKNNFSRNYQYSNNNNNKKESNSINNNSKYNDRRNHIYINDILKKKENLNKKCKEDLRMKRDKDKERRHNIIISKYNTNYLLQSRENNNIKSKYNRIEKKYVY